VIVLQGRSQEPHSLTFSPDGNYLACGGSATHVQLWDLTKPGKAKGVLGPKGPHYGVTFIGDDLLLSASCLSGYREYFGLRLARRPFTSVLLQIDPGGSYWDARATNDGRAVILTDPSANYPGLTTRSSVVCLELPDLNLRWVAPQPARDANAVRVSLCPDGNVVANFRTQTQLIDVQSGKVLRTVAEHEPCGAHPAVSPDGKLLAFGGKDVTVVELATGKPEAQLKLPGQRWLRELAFHPSGRMLMAATKDVKVALYDPTTLAELAAFDWGVGKVQAVAFSSDGMRAAAAGEKGKVVVWDVDL
jgi:WD40 repeat protein